MKGKKATHKSLPSPQDLNGIEEKAMRMRFNGSKYSEIATAINKKEQRIRCWFMRGGKLNKRYEEFKRQAFELVPGLEIKTVTEMIREQAPKSVKTIVQIRDSDANPAVRYMSAKDILDRAGFAPVQKTANIHVVEEMSAQELDKTFELLLKSAKERPTILPE